MTELTAQSAHYRHEGTDHVGYLVTEPGTPRPGVLLIHDAMGVSEPMKATARRIAELGYAVLLADLWGNGATPVSDEEFGPLIGGLAADRELWTGRIRAAHEVLSAQDDVVDGPVTAAGYCFGGASVLEYVRTGASIDGAVSFHGGLDLVSTDWTDANPDAAVLILTGAQDPMAPRGVVDALEQAMTDAGVDWEVSSYGGAKHGFTNPHADQAGQPEVIAYDARADRRSWNAFSRFLEETRQRVSADA